MVLIRQKWLYSDKSGCNGAKLLYSGKSGSIRKKVVVLRQKWLYSGKVDVFEGKLLYSGKVVVLGQK